MGHSNKERWYEIKISSEQFVQKDLMNFFDNWDSYIT